MLTSPPLLPPASLPFLCGFSVVPYMGLLHCRLYITQYYFIFQIHIPQIYSYLPITHYCTCGTLVLQNGSPPSFLTSSTAGQSEFTCSDNMFRIIPNMGEVEYNGNHLGATKVSATCGAFGTRNIIAFLQKDRMSIQIVMFSGCDKRISTSGVWNSGLCLAFRQIWVLVCEGAPP